MNKICKRIIFSIALVLLITVFVLNLIFNVQIDVDEFLTTNINSIIYVGASILIAVLLYIINIRLEKNKISKTVKYIILKIIIIIYFFIQIGWITYRDAVPAVDQKTTYKFAVDMVKDIDAISDTTYGVKIPNTIYMQEYQQQFTTAFAWSILFRVFSSTNYIIVQYFNALCNCITIIAIFLITKQISKKHKTNKYLSMTLILTFITIPLLSIFVYGDESGLAFSLLGVYLLMKHVETEKYRWALLSSICISISYILRMNFLIFIIASVIYLILNLLKEKPSLKRILLKISTIIIFLVICMLPAILIKNHCVKKYNLDKDATFPVTGYLLMGMTNGGNGEPGWYNSPTARRAYENLESAKEVYSRDIKRVLEYFKDNPKFCISFYIRKITSMWAQNSYGGIYYNLSPTFCYKNYTDKYDLDNKLLSIEKTVDIYQKALILIIFGCSIIVIIQNRKNLSEELVFLITIFIGGFLFHILWEAKSRYIIPYIIVLIPVATVKVKVTKEKINKILEKIKKERKEMM